MWNFLARLTTSKEKMKGIGSDNPNFGGYAYLMPTTTPHSGSIVGSGDYVGSENPGSGQVTASQVYALQYYEQTNEATVDMTFRFLRNAGGGDAYQSIQIIKDPTTSGAQAVFVFPITGSFAGFSGERKSITIRVKLKYVGDTC